MRSSLLTPTPHRPPPTRTPVVPRVDFPTGTEILVNDVVSCPPMRPGPSDDGLVESLCYGDRLVVTGDYVVSDEGLHTARVWWPVSDPELD